MDSSEVEVPGMLRTLPSVGCASNELAALHSISVVHRASRGPPQFFGGSAPPCGIANADSIVLVDPFFGLILVPETCLEPDDLELAPELEVEPELVLELELELELEELDQELNLWRPLDLLFGGSADTRVVFSTSSVLDRIDRISANSFSFCSIFARSSSFDFCWPCFI